MALGITADVFSTRRVSFCRLILHSLMAVLAQTPRSTTPRISTSTSDISSRPGSSQVQDRSPNSGTNMFSPTALWRRATRPDPKPHPPQEQHLVLNLAMNSLIKLVGRPTKAQYGMLLTWRRRSLGKIPWVRLISHIYIIFRLSYTVSIPHRYRK
jgi:hypothetical protein